MQEALGEISKLSFSQPSQLLLLLKNQRAINKILWSSSLSGSIAANSPSLFHFRPAVIPEALSPNAPLDPIHRPVAHSLLLARVDSGCLPRRPSYWPLWLLGLLRPDSLPRVQKLLFRSFHERHQSDNCEDEDVEGGDWEQPHELGSKCVRVEEFVWRAN